MASQDYISQFSQGIPSTQPDRSPSRTPRRGMGSTPPDPSVPAFRGPLHMATNFHRPPNFSYNPTWTPPRLPLTPCSTTPSPLRWPAMQPTNYSTQPLFPPMPPTQSPPPPPTAHQPDSPKVQYHSSKVTYLYTSAFYLANPKRLSRPHLRDPSYATMET